MATRMGASTPTTATTPVQINLGDDPADPQFVRTVRGVGYKLQSPGGDRPNRPATAT